MGFGASCLLKFLWTAHENWILKNRKHHAIYSHWTYLSFKNKKVNTYNLYKNCKTRLWLFIKCLTEMFFKQAEKQKTRRCLPRFHVRIVFSSKPQTEPLRLKSWGMNKSFRVKHLFVPCEETAWFSWSLVQLNWCWNESKETVKKPWIHYVSMAFEDIILTKTAKKKHSNI